MRANACKHSVEWVAMFDVESSSLNSVIVCDGEVTETVGNDEFVELAQRVFCTRQFSDAMFGRDFPCACGADEHSVGLICDGCRSPLGQARIVLPPPQQRVGVEQEAH